MTKNLPWCFELTESAERDLSKLDKPIKQRIITFFEERVLPQANPRLFGKALTGRLSGYWAYRIGDYRVITDIQDNQLTIIAIKIAHRRNVYQD